MAAVVSNHAEKRIRERVGLKKKCVDKNAEKALEKGLKHSDVRGRLKKYMDKIYLSGRNVNNARIYHHFVYLFHDNLLITVVPLPRELHAAADSQSKKISA